MSNDQKLILLGRILGAHGIHGAVLIKSFTGDPEAIASYGPLTDENGNNPLTLKVQRNTNKGVIVRVQNITDRNHAEQLKGRELYVKRSELPEPEADEFYHVDLIGLKVKDEEGNKIGTVIDIANYGAGDILEIKLTNKNNTELIPFKPDFVPNVDLDNGSITIALPQDTDDEDDTD